MAEQTLPDLVPKGRALGEHEGEAVIVGKSKQGTYVRWGKTFFDMAGEPEEATLERAVAAIQAGQERASEREEATLATFGKLRIIQGRYGPYFTDGKQRASVPKWEVEHIASWDGKRAREVFKAQLAYKKSASKGKVKGKVSTTRKQTSMGKR